MLHISTQNLTSLNKKTQLKDIKNGKIDLLYLAPETLLAYNINTFIGNRKIGLFIVDEAHIVTTWGKGFRPDYWYLGKYLYRVRNDEHRFPIITFTATAVYGGNDDMYDDTIESLNMRATNKYLGNIKRDDIHFKITNTEINRLSKELYEKKKKVFLKTTLIKNLKLRKKTIVYFPFASLALSMYHDTLFDDIKKHVSVYTGQIDKIYKSLEAESFKTGEKSIMFATKAFGMGIDINDIAFVYHYAPTGNLGDYVQEIGRAARSENIEGTAAIDFLPNDFNFINMLFGISAIKQHEVKAVMRKLYKIYTRKEQQNFLVTPNDFSFIFPNESKRGLDNLERKLKTVLLMIENDLINQLGIPVLISRPRSMFSKVFVVIDREHEKRVLDSKYSQYFSKISNGRHREHIGVVDVSDGGDVFLLDLKSMWENHYPDLSFAQFKYFMLSSENHSDVKFEFKSYLHQRYKINIIANNDLKISELKNALSHEIDKVNSVFDKFKDEQRNFSIPEFESALFAIYPNKETVRAISSSYIDLIAPVQNQNFQTRNSIEFNASIKKYRINNRTYHNVKRDFLDRSNIVRMLNSHSTSISMFYPKTDKKDYDLFRALYLFEIFGLASYEILGGSNPEIFIRLNDPIKISRISSELSTFNNLILKDVRKRHENSTLILKKFYTGYSTDEERWNFIEDYFLGKDLLTD